MYTLSLSPGWVTTVCVCEPRQVWTLATSFGFFTSAMSKMRTPRIRSLLTCSIGASPSANEQLRRLFVASDDMKRRFL